MNDDATLARVFSALDHGDAPVPDYADRLWQVLDETLDRGASDSTLGLDAEVPVRVVSGRSETGRAEPDRGERDSDGWIELVGARDLMRRRRLRGRWAAVGAAAAVAVSVVLAVDDRDAGETVDAIDRSPAFVVPLSPAEACAVYFADGWSVDRLVASDLESADFDAALDALDRLAVSLNGAGVADIVPIDVARGLVRQAGLEIEAGDVARAARTLARAPELVRMIDEQSGEARCVPAGP